MAKIIPFPLPKIQLTVEETKEYFEIKEELANVRTLRQLYYCTKKMKAFKKALKKRLESK